MKLYIVSMELRSEKFDYTEFMDQLAHFPEVWKYSKSFWIIKTHINASEIMNLLTKFIDSQDKLFVALLGDDIDYYGFDKDAHVKLNEFFKL